MKVLLLGASGFLGGHVYEKLKLNKYEVMGTSHSSTITNFTQLDVTDEVQFEKLYLVCSPDVVIWSLMSSNNEPALIQKGLANLIKIIAPATRFIFVSTDGVFSSGEGNFSEDSEASYLSEHNPLASYTNAKLDGEKIIQANHPNHVIIRTGPLYGKSVKGKWDTRISLLQENLRTGRIYKRLDNLHKTFVHVEDLAEVLIELCANEYTGILHVGPSTKESYYSFNLKIAKQQKLNERLLVAESISIKEANEKGLALDTSLDTTKSSIQLNTKFRSVGCGVVQKSGQTQKRSVVMTVYETIDFYKNTIRQHTPEQLTFSPSTEKWSMSQIIQHCIDVADEYLENALECAKSGSEQHDGKTEFGERLFTNGGFPPIKIKLPDEMNAPPANTGDKDELTNQLNDLIDRMEKAEKYLTEVDSNLAIRHGGFGWLNTREWFDLIDMHFRHHVRQINEMEETLK